MADEPKLPTGWKATLEDRAVTGRVSPGFVRPREVEFDWEAIDGIDPPSEEEMSRRAVTDALAWIFSFVLAGEENFKTKPFTTAVAFRRFLALGYVYRPDLMDGATIRKLSGDLDVSTQAVNKYIADVALEFAASGVNQKALANRLACQHSQIQKAAAKNKTRKRRRVTGG